MCVCTLNLGLRYSSVGRVLAKMHEALSCSPSIIQVDVVGQICKDNTQEVKAGESCILSYIVSSRPEYRQSLSCLVSESVYLTFLNSSMK